MSKPLAPETPGLRHLEPEDLRQHLQRRETLTQATLHSDNSVYAQLDVDVGPKKVAKTAKLLGITTKLDGVPSEGARRPAPRRLAARDGLRLRDARRRRHPQRAAGDQEGRVPRRQVRRPRQAEAQARHHRRRGLRGHEGPREEHPGRHRRQRELRLPGRRQDRHDRQLRRRLVRRLHAAPLDRRLGRLPERASR